MIRIFIGYDKAESVAYHVLAHSILARASVPVMIAPLKRESMPFFTRPRGEYDSTDFAISRFLVPYLCDYRGWALFLDCDMLCLGDVAKVAHLATLANTYNGAVRVVKHHYVPRDEVKFLGAVQTQYKKKNWSSVMLFNNRLCQNLTLPYVSTAPGLDLHQFRWCDETQVLGLPAEWNYLVDEENQVEKPELVHYTRGGPWFKGYEGCGYADAWRREFREMTGREYGRPA